MINVIAHLFTSEFAEREFKNTGQCVVSSNFGYDIETSSDGPEPFAIGCSPK